ncbi:MAG: universal stress protein [Crocosphaera sp.]
MNLLVAVDCSDSTETVVKKAQEMAQLLSATLWIVHIAEPEPDFVGFDTGPQSARDYQAQTFHSEHSQIQAIAAQLRKEGIETTALLIQGPTVETLLKEAKKLEVDMIIMGAHRRNAIAELFMGSVSKGVVSHSPCPVVIVPTHH